MKPSRWALGLMVLGVVVFSPRCNRAAPTEPGGAVETEAVGSAASGFSGSWNGTITFHPYSDIEGDTGTSPCNETTSIAVTLEQDGQKLTGQFQSGCGGILEMDGVLAGTNLSGSLDSSSGPGFGRIYGTVSASRIQFRTVQMAEDTDDPDGRDNDGDAAYTSTNVDLHRTPQRTTPIAVGRERAPRLLSGRR